MNTKIKFTDKEYMYNMVKDLTAQALFNIGRTMMLEAQWRSPVQTGYLKASWHTQIDIKQDHVEYTLYNTAKYSNNPAYYDRSGTRYSPIRETRSHEKLFQSMQWAYTSTMSPLVEDMIISYINQKPKPFEFPDIDFQSTRGGVI